MSVKSPKHYQVMIGLTFLGVVTYWRGATSPALFGDEWGRVSQIAYGGQACPISTIFTEPLSRPLRACYYLALNTLLGREFSAFHAVSLVWVVTSAAFVYLIIDRLLPQHRYVSVAAAVLFLIYPSNFFRFSFEWGPSEIAYFLLLAGVWIWIGWYRAPRTEAVLLTFLLIVASLLLYEAQIGVILFISATFFLAARGASLPRRILNLVPAALVATYAVGLVITQNSKGMNFGRATEPVVLAPDQIVMRFYLAIRTLLQWSWTRALQQFVPYREQPGIVVVIGVIFVSAIIAIFSWRTRVQDKWRLPHSENEHRRLLFVGLMGICVAFAGFVPMVAAVEPSLTSLGSQINILPSIGAAVTIAVAVYFVSYLLGGQKWHNPVYAALVASLLLLGAGAQYLSQNCTATAWEKQKSMWRQMTGVAPNLASDTYVAMLVTYSADPACYGGAQPLEGGPWGFRGALSVIYGHADLSGGFAYVDPASLEVMYGNIVADGTPRLAFLYDQANSKLSLVQESDHPWGSTCRDCIVSLPAGGQGWRWLINQHGGS